MKYALITIALSGAGIAGIAQADLLVEFSLHTDISWDETDKAYDVSMLIGDIEQLGSMPYGTYSYDLTMEVTGRLPGPWQDATFTYNGVVTGSNTTYEEGWWGDLGFLIPNSDQVFDFFYPGANSMSLEWGIFNSDPDDVQFSYGLGQWNGGLADAAGVDVLYIDTNTLVETVVPAPAALGLLGVTVLAGRRRRR